MTAIKSSLSNNPWIIPAMAFTIIAMILVIFLLPEWAIFAALLIPILLSGLYLFILRPGSLLTIF